VSNDLVLPSHCAVGDCERPTRGGRTLCEAHEKRKQRGQPLTAEISERLSPKQRLIEAALRLVDTDPEDDTAWEANERAVIRAARVFAPSATGEIIRQALADARARGVRLGAPPKIDGAQARQMVKRLGSITLAAKALGVDRDTVSRALKRAGQSGILRRTDREERRGRILFTATAGLSAR
jgi:nucleotide-binding universal stress UspA family protein